MFYFDFSSKSHVTNTILFSPRKDYFITSMFCSVNIKPDISKSVNKYKEIKELSDFGKESESNGSNVFFNIREIWLKSDAVGYKEPFEKTFKLVTDKQKLFNHEFNFNLDEKKIKKQQYTDPTTIFKQAAFSLKMTPKKKLTT